MKDLYDQSLAATSFTLVMLAITLTMALLLGVVGILASCLIRFRNAPAKWGYDLPLGPRRDN
jgi:hypothetical protein